MLGASDEHFPVDRGGEGLRLSVIGICAGLIAAAFVTRVMASMLIGVKPTDPLTFSAMAVLFTRSPPWPAGCRPARRRVDPTVALRGE